MTPSQDGSRPTPGYYLEPESGLMRWFDGNTWGPYAPGHELPGQVGGVTIVQGPNHVLHGILSFLTLPFAFFTFGVLWWGWVWLIVALVNNKRVRRIY